MIKYALTCEGDHEFDVWFASSKAYDEQSERGLIECPVCGSIKVTKQIMAPAVRASGQKSGRSSPMTSAPPQLPDISPEQFEKMASKVREHIAKTHHYVGDTFAEEARAMHYGEKDHKPVWGETSPEQARELADEGVAALPLPAPFAPPKPIPSDPKKLN